MLINACIGPGQECSALQNCMSVNFNFCNHMERLTEPRVRRYTNTFVTNLLSRATLKYELRRTQEYRAARYIILPASTPASRTPGHTLPGPADGSVHWVRERDAQPTDAIVTKTQFARSNNWKEWNVVSLRASSCCLSPWAHERALIQGVAMLQRRSSCV